MTVCNCGRDCDPDHCLTLEDEMRQTSRVADILEELRVIGCWVAVHDLAKRVSVSTQHAEELLSLAGDQVQRAPGIVRIDHYQETPTR